jgi:hypothetical protein
MTMRTLTRLYDNHTDAVSAVHALEAAGFGHDDVSIVSSQHGHAAALGTAGDPTVNENEVRHAPGGDPTPAEIGAGATLGTVVGGGLGLLAGVGALAIPGVGLVVAAGWLVAALTGAGVGAAIGGGAAGLVGALINVGTDEEDAYMYAETIRRGGSMVTARISDDRVAEAERILDSTFHVDPAEQRSRYIEGGSTNFDT